MLGLVGCGGGSTPTPTPTPTPVHNRLELGFYRTDGLPMPASQQWFHNGSAIYQATGVQQIMDGVISNNGTYHVEFPGGSSNDIIVEFYPSAAVAGVRITANGNVSAFAFNP